MDSEIHLFGGQGWAGLFQGRSIAVATRDASASRYAEELLRRCHKCLIKDVSSLCFRGDEEIAQFLSAFSSPNSLLRPPKPLQTHPCIQGITLCLFQLLRFLAEALNESTYEDSFNRIHGTTGFCSGILAAIVVAASSTEAEFVEYGVEAFRAAFWIGYRTAEYSQRVISHTEPGDGPWTYNLSGVSPSRVADLLSHYNSETEVDMQISLAAILRDSNVCVSGPSPAFKRFLPQLPASCVARPVYVNGLYHGGERGAPLVDTILQDYETNKVLLPSFRDLRRHVCSPVDGSKFSGSHPSMTLAREVLEIMLVKPSNWTEVLRSLEIEHKIRTAVVYGPNPYILIPSSMVSLDGGLQRRDVSHENPAIQLMSNYHQSNQDIAIIGVGLDLPNGSTLDEFWESLKQGVNCVSPTPEDRFPSQKRYGKDTHTTPHHGNFVRSPWAFDNALFGISPREAKSMDPQQRVLLQCSYHALQHAGYVADATRCSQRETFGCYVGAATGDYVDRMSEELDVYYSPGTLRAFLSGRISYCFGLTGPSVVVDTACSGSLVAIHQACRALIANECNAALAGGVNVICGPNMQRGLARARFLSPQGQCRPFDAEADGYCRAEGGVMFVLKRLRDAVAENDRILGVIKATGLNQSGNADSITHPHAETQKQLFRSVTAQSNILPQSITAVEAHGTGTQAGDPIEFESITSVFGKGRTPANPLILSSIKGNIGHAEAASGAAGLAKLLMMMKSGQAPPQVGLKVLNPKIAAMKDENTIIPDRLLDWPRLGNMPRRALVNNFGAAGSNACLILEEYVPKKDGPRESEEHSAYLFVLSAKNNVALERYRQLLLQDVGLRNVPLRDLAYTSTTRREMLKSRLVITASTSEELFQSIEETSILSLEPSRGDSRPQVVFVFSGQGSQYLGMGKELFETTSSFREDILLCEGTLAEAGYPSILPLIHTPASSTLSLGDFGMLVTHCAIFAVEYSLARLYMSWGIRPDALLGHSLGEYAAFVHAKVISLRDALLIIARRATMVEELCEVGTSSMLSINASAHFTREFLSKMTPSPSSVAIACDNSKHQCVLSGPTDQIDSFATVLKSAGIKAKKLEVPFGYHSPAMEAIRLPFNDLVSKVRLQEPTLPLGLGFYGRMQRAGDISHEYFSSQAISPVRFRETAEDLLKTHIKGPTVCLEIGPHPVVLPMMRAILPHSSTQFLSSLGRDTKNWTSVCQSLAHFVRSGVEIDFAKLFEGQGCRLVDMSLYPFSKEEFVVPYITPGPQRDLHSKLARLAHNAGSGSLLSIKAPMNMLSEDQPTYEANERVEEFIQGHRVADFPLCPASVYIELALQAARNSQHFKGGDEGNTKIIVENVVFSSPLVRHENQLPSDVPIQVTLNQTSERLNCVSFRVNSVVDGVNQKNCEGLLTFSGEDEVDRTKHADTMSTHFRGFRDYGQLIKRKMLYETIFSRVVTYSDLYQTIDHLELSDSGRSAWGSFRLRQPAVLENGVSQPVFVDTLLHAAGFLANCSVRNADVCICIGIESVSINADVADYTESFRLYTEIANIDRNVIGNSFAYDSDGKLVGSVRGITFRQLGKEKFMKSLRASIPNTQSSHSFTPGMYGVNIVNGTATPVEPEDGMYSVSMIGVNSIHNNNNTPNGNTPAQTTSTAPTADQVQSAVAEVAGLAKNRVNGKSNLQYLGLDSFMTFELLDLIKVRFGIEISHNEFESCQTPDDITRLIKPQATQPSEQPERQGNRAASKCLALIQRGEDEAVPIYLIHDGSGVCSMYSAISSLGRNIFGISCDPDHRFQSVGQMAAAYAILINTAKPFIVGGWSFGGVVAYEVARILHEQQAPVLGVIMVDSPCPTTHEGIPKSILQRVSEGKPEWLMRNFETHSAMLAAYRPAPPATAGFPMVLLRSAEAEHLGDEWCPFLGDGPERRELTNQWMTLVGSQLRVLEIPGSHFEAFSKKFVGDTSRAISQAIEMIQQVPSV